MDNPQNSLYRFIIDDNISPQIIEYLLSGNFKVVPFRFVQQVKKNKRQAVNEKSVFLTADARYLNKKFLGRYVSQGICKVIIQAPEESIQHEYGNLIARFIEHIGLSGKKKISELIIEIGKTIVVHRSIDKAEVSEEYSFTITGGKFFFTKADKKYDMTQYKKQLLDIGKMRKGHLRYDDIYNVLPPYLSDAKTVDDTINFLKEKGIKVIEIADNRERGEHDLLASRFGDIKGPLDQELFDMEQDIEKSLQDMLAGLYEPPEEKRVPATAVQDAAASEPPPAVTVSAKIHLPNIPHISNVSPGITEGAFMSVSKEQKREKKQALLKERQPIDKFASLMEGAVERGQDDAEIPKLYDSPKLSNDRRLSLYAGIVGRRAEEIVVKLLQENLTGGEKEGIVWRSRQGETPGWDIDYANADGQLIAIEVKGTTGKSFPNVEITGNEWEAACKLQDRFWLYLVTECFTTDPKIQRIQNPYLMKESGKMSVTPILWRMELLRDSANIE